MEKLKEVETRVKQVRKEHGSLAQLTSPGSPDYDPPGSVGHWVESLEDLRSTQPTEFREHRKQIRRRDESGRAILKSSIFSEQSAYTPRLRKDYAEQPDGRTLH